MTFPYGKRHDRDGVKAKWKGIIIGALALSLLAAAVKTVYVIKYVQVNGAMQNLIRHIEEEGVDDLKMTIYYSGLNYLTTIPWDIDQVIRAREVDGKIVVQGGQLEELVDLLERMKKTKVLPYIVEDYMDVRIYFEIKSEKGEKLFDLAIGAAMNDMYVNGIEVKSNAMFCDIIMPFMPEDSVSELKFYIDFLGL